MRASVARDPDDPIVSFFARLQTVDEVDLLNMGVGSVSPEGQEIEVETRKVFSYRVASELPEKTRKTEASGPISSLKLELSIVPNSERLSLKISSQKLSESISDQRTAYHIM